MRSNLYGLHLGVCNFWRFGFKLKGSGFTALWRMNIEVHVLGFRF